QTAPQRNTPSAFWMHKPPQQSSATAHASPSGRHVSSTLRWQRLAPPTATRHVWMPLSQHSPLFWQSSPRRLHPEGKEPWQAPSLADWQPRKVLQRLTPSSVGVQRYEQQSVSESHRSPMTRQPPKNSQRFWACDPSSRRQACEQQLGLVEHTSPITKQLLGS